MRLLSLRCRIETKAPERTLTLLIRSAIPFSRPHRENDALSFSCNIFSKRALNRWCVSQNLPLSCSYEGCLVPILGLKRRPGIIFGIFLSLFFIHLSTFFIWSVKIEGNNKLSDSDVIYELQKCGFGVGTRKSAVDTDYIENTVLTRCHELSFLSINVHGMVAEVVVHERDTTEGAIDAEQPYNLVADYDGVIVSALVLDGQAMFKLGDTVTKGQLLISGLMDSAVGTTVTAHARGKVWARTYRTLSFEVPLETVERHYTHTEELHGFEVLGKSFPTTSGDESGSYDLELEEHEISLLGLELPIKRTVRRVKYYEEKAVILTREEAEAAALDDYRRYISTELDGASVISEELSSSLTDSSLIMTVNIIATENIAKEKKIEITE